MKKYIGTKMVQAEPMNELQAVELGYARPNEDDHEWRLGYHVLYPDGYHSWSPKSVFEASYQLNETFVDRLFIEKQDLQEKCTKLGDFLFSQPFNQLDNETRDLLISQFGAMRAYYRCLEKRIELLMRKEPEEDCPQCCGKAD